MLSHRCGGSCLGPLTFHHQVFGDKVSLSQGGRLARREGSTFKNGLVFSSRPLGVQEKIHLKVVESTGRWHGALRVGFTNVHPAARGLPLAPMAIPDLIQKPGHWAVAVHESCCTLGSELRFWVSSRGKVYMRVNNSNRDEEILDGVDVSRPLWALVDIYGQTSCIYLQGEFTTEPNNLVAAAAAAAACFSCSCFKVFAGCFSVRVETSLFNVSALPHRLRKTRKVPYEAILPCASTHHPACYWPQQPDP